VTQGEVLEGELVVAAAEEREESQQVEQKDDHQARILSGPELINQPPAHRIEFWRSTAPGGLSGIGAGPPSEGHRSPTQDPEEPVLEVKV
jgi:hypothetical protein